MDSKKTHVVLLNSKDRRSESKSKYDCSFHLNDHFLHEATSVRFKSICLSANLYNIDATNFTINYENLGVPISVNIAPGSYNITSLIVAINAAQAHFTIVDNTVTRIFEFTSAANTQILFTSSMAKVLGLNQNTAVGTSYSAQQVYTLVYTYNLHVLSPQLARGDNLISSDQKQKPVIASFALNVGFGFLLQYDVEGGVDTNDYSVLYGDSNLSTVDIQIVDDNWNVVDLQQSDWVLEVLVKTI